MNDPMEVKPVRFGYLYKMAWGFEILAACTGLTVALTQLEIGNDFIQVLPIVLAFALVAVAELTKIPLTSVAFNANSMMWRAFFTVAVILLSTITFETMVNGLTNGAAYRTADITKLDEQILEKRAELVNLKDNKIVLEESVVGGKIETNLKAELEKTNERLAAYQCDTITSSRTWYTAFIGSKQHVHTNETCAAEKKKQQNRADNTQQQLDLIKSNSYNIQEQINAADSAIDAANKEIVEVSRAKADLSRTNNIYTMAFTILPAVDALYSIEREEELVSPAQMSQADVNRTIQIFFGTLAFIVAFTGPFLAAAFTVLNHENGKLKRTVVYNAKGEVISDHQDRTLGNFSAMDNNGNF